MVIPPLCQEVFDFAVFNKAQTVIVEVVAVVVVIAIVQFFFNLIYIDFRATQHNERFLQRINRKGINGTTGLE